MIYLIGGPARCGKSTLAARVRKRVDGHVLAGDAFVKSLQANLEPQWMPDVFDHDVANIHDFSDPENQIDRLRRRDEMMWQFYDAYIKMALADAPHDDILLEGNLWPDYLELFTPAHKAVFLIDTSPDQWRRLTDIRDSDSDNNWMRGFSDEKLAEWAQFNAARSRRYIEPCKAAGYPYFDIAELGAAEAEQQAFDYLVGNTV